MRAILIAEDAEEWAYLQWRKGDLDVQASSELGTYVLPRDNVTIVEMEKVDEALRGSPFGDVADRVHDALS